jgi:hypothetical protein
MPYGFGGGGFGFRGGMGFSFRGSSPPWPYVGIGRGGLPRHEYFFSGAGVAPAFGNAPFAPQVTPEQEIDFLRNQAEAISEQLEQIEARIQQLGSES